MRLVLTVRGVNVLDLELLWPTAHEHDDGPPIEASGAGQYERADSYGDPATQYGFGFRMRE